MTSTLPADIGAMIPSSALDTSGFGAVIEALRNGTVRHVVAPTPRQQMPYAAAGLRTAGLGFLDIAQVLGLYDPTGLDPLSLPVDEAIQKAKDLSAKGLALLVQHDDTHRESMRQLMDNRINQLLSAVWPKAIDPAHPQQLTASKRAVEIIDRHTRLWGLNAPQEHVINVPGAERIAELIRQVAAPTEEIDVFEVYPDAEIVPDPPAIEDLL